MSDSPEQESVNCIYKYIYKYYRSVGDDWSHTHYLSPVDDDDDVIPGYNCHNIFKKGPGLFSLVEEFCSFSLK